jgi:phenylpropionate dioxygenase-like ring-hydroxylating dioxygenase large terminal subunit
MGSQTDFTRYRREKTDQCVKEWSTLDGDARRVTDDECGTDWVPKDAYVSRQWLELEKIHLWPHVWQVVCREHDIADVGDYFEYEILDETILVVRTAASTIKGFYNVCQHRGRKLRTGCGHAERLQCGYHGWCWDLDGQILDVLDPQDFRADLIAPDELALGQVRVETWGGFVFINMDLDAPPLRDVIAPVPGRLDHHEYERLRYTSWKRISLPFNWKLGVESTLEIYHNFRTHPQSSYYLDDTRIGIYERWANGTEWLNQRPDWLQNLARPSARLGIDPDAKEILWAMLNDFVSTGLLSEDEMQMVDVLKEMDLPSGEEGREFIRTLLLMHRRTQLSALGVDATTYTDDDVVTPNGLLLFPNLAAILQLGTGFCLRFLPDRDDPCRCTMDHWNLQFLPPDEEPKAVEMEEVDDLSAETWGLILAQDLANLVAVGRGVRSRGFVGQRLGYQENNIKFYNRKIAEILGWNGVDQRSVY